MRYCLIKRDDSFSEEVENSIAKKLEHDSFFSKDSIHPELVIVIGGDGTFLAALHHYMTHVDSLRFLCFNTGRIGYYNEFSISDVDMALEGVKDGTLKTKSFPLLALNGEKETHYAVNEFIVSGLLKNVEYDILLDGQFLEHYFGMGLVVSTTTGSMGYNRSIFGSILDTKLRAMELTEIAAIRSKAYQPIGSPVVIDGGRTLTFQEKNHRPATLLQDNLTFQKEADPVFTIQYGTKNAMCYVKDDDVFVPRLRKTLGY